MKPFTKVKRAVQSLANAIAAASAAEASGMRSAADLKDKEVIAWSRYRMAIAEFEVWWDQAWKDKLPVDRDLVKQAAEALEYKAHMEAGVSMAPNLFDAEDTEEWKGAQTLRKLLKEAP